MKINPRDYEFENKYMQKNWEEFLNLNDCKKVDYLDSIYTPVLFDFKLKVPYDSLLYNNNENLYYWIFREIHWITKESPSIIYQHGGYGGTHNRQVVPNYSNDGEVSQSQFKMDIKSWKDSLGCD